jgi:hypothetical protein
MPAPLRAVPPTQSVPWLPRIGVPARWWQWSASRHCPRCPADARLCRSDGACEHIDELVASVGADGDPIRLRALNPPDPDGVTRPDRVRAEVPRAERSPRPGVAGATERRQVEGCKADPASSDPAVVVVDADVRAPESPDVDGPRHERQRHDQRSHRQERDGHDCQEPEPRSSVRPKVLHEERRGRCDRRRRRRHAGRTVRCRRLVTEPGGSL